LYDALKADQVDALIAGLTIDLSRLEAVHYSQPYFNAGLVLVSGNGLVGMEQMPERSLAYELGSEADTEARTWLRRILPFETRPYETARAALDAARLGDADAALVDSVSARLYLRAHAEWAAASNRVTDNLYAIATQSRRPEISVAINDALQALIDDGTRDALIHRWL
jgi:ABC-type amino acid transport substrate-binding protein